MKKTLASIESFTGGMFASKIVSISGASTFFKGSLVTYSNEIKEKLGVDTSKGVINKEVALAMALKGKDFFNVDYCISFTGNAGPTSMEEDKKVGQVYIAINDQVYELFLEGNRNDIREKAVEFAFSEIKKLGF